VQVEPMRLLKFASEVRSGEDGVITAVLSTESVDRDGDVVQLAGWDLSNFSKAPRLLSCHEYGKLTSLDRGHAQQVGLGVHGRRRRREPLRHERTARTALYLPWL
jgi:hypothetical protein